MLVLMLYEMRGNPGIDDKPRLYECGKRYKIDSYLWRSFAAAGAAVVVNPYHERQENGISQKQKRLATPRGGKSHRFVEERIRKR